MTRRLLPQKKIEDDDAHRLEPRRRKRGRFPGSPAPSPKAVCPAYVAHAKKIYLKLNAAMAGQARGNYRVLWPGGNGRGNLNGSNLPFRRDVCNCAFRGEMVVMGTAIARLKV